MKGRTEAAAARLRLTEGIYRASALAADGRSGCVASGFSLVELLVVMAIIRAAGHHGLVQHAGRRSSGCQKLPSGQ